jgi:hypothetical protein
MSYITSVHFRPEEHACHVPSLDLSCKARVALGQGSDIAFDQTIKVGVEHVVRIFIVGVIA